MFAEAHEIVGVDAGEEAFFVVGDEDKDGYFVFVLSWFLDLVEEGSGTVRSFSVLDFKVEAGIGTIAGGAIVSAGGSGESLPADCSAQVLTEPGCDPALNDFPGAIGRHGSYSLESSSSELSG